MIQEYWPKKIRNLHFHLLSWGKILMNQNFRLDIYSLRGLCGKYFKPHPISPWPTPEFIFSCGGQCLYAQSASFFRHWGLSPVKRSLLDCVRGTQKDLWLNTPRGNPETLRGQGMLTHPLLLMFQWDNPEACVYRVPQRFPGRLSSICSQWSPAYQYAFYGLIFLPISIVYPLTSYSCLPASSPSEVSTPARCRVCLGGVQPKTIKHPNINIQEGGEYTILEIRGNVRDWSIARGVRLLQVCVKALCTRSEYG